MPVKPALYIFSGLPGSGKTTLAKGIAARFTTVYLRIDTIEQGLRDLCGTDVQGEGYRLSYRIAVDNLQLGNSVVADSCNPIALTRGEWEACALSVDARYMNVEVFCSDKSEHRRRVESRGTSIGGLQLPSWHEVETREYQAWEKEVIRVDTAGRSAESSLSELVVKIGEAARSQTNL